MNDDGSVGEQILSTPKGLDSRLSIMLVVSRLNSMNCWRTALKLTQHTWKF